MKAATTTSAIERQVLRFSRLDIHDDTIENVTFYPAATRRSSATVEVVFYRHWEQRRRQITFNGCSNFEVIVDADILADNAPSNTSSATATSERDTIERVLRRHKRNWNVDYAPTISRQGMKSRKASACGLFRLQYFGGIMLVLARSFTIKTIA
jgi:hypothetical protein